MLDRTSKISTFVNYNGNCNFVFVCVLLCSVTLFKSIYPEILTNYGFYAVRINVIIIIVIVPTHIRKTIIYYI